jgi:hypothetical protein
MKLLEDMQDMGGSIHAAIQKMINDMFHEELDDDVIDDIVSNLSLSDLLALDKAYTNGDKETVRDVIGPLPQLEYSMGVSRPQPTFTKPTSAASARPAPNAAAGQQKKTGAGTVNTVQTNRNYNSGAQNAVTTQKIDTQNPDDPNAPPQDDEELKEVKETNVVDMVEWLKRRAGIK